MDFLDIFSLPFSGMKDGIHRFDFDIDRNFFKAFDNLPVEDGNLKVELEVDKRAQHSILNFDIKGTVATQCDRCLADIGLPVEGKQTLHIKVGKGVEDDEVIFVPEETIRINISQYIYEFICLSIPAIKVFDCASLVPKPCDTVVLSKLTLQTEDQNQISDGPLAALLKESGEKLN